MEQQEQSQEQQVTQVQIGFEKALTMVDPDWRTKLSKEQVNQFRHFYHQGIQDLYFLVRLQNDQMAQNFQSVLNTVMVTGNEEEIAKAQEDAQKAAEAEATPVSKPEKKTAKKPAKKGKK